MARTKEASKAKAKESPEAAAAASLGEALLFATVCMVGLPVEVQVRDGSAYAGVFHTACVDGGYGVVLKKARKIVKGKDDTNLVLGAFVDTLVVLPGDLVQVIAKDFALPTKGIAGTTSDCDVEAATGSAKPHTSDASPIRQAQKYSGLGQEQEVSITKNDIPPNCNLMSSGRHTGDTGPEALKNGFSSSAAVRLLDAANSVLTSFSLASDIRGFPPADNSAAKVKMSSNSTAKVSKLNPGAKVFSPSFTSFGPTTAAAPPSVNTNYTSNSFPEVPTGLPVFEINSVRRCSSLISNAVPYNNLAPGSRGIAPHYVQPIMGHNASRVEPVRFGTPYQPLQAGPTYISSNSQPVMAGKFSPVVYVHPISQDAIQGTPVISQGWTRPMLMSPYQASIQKFQGTAPIVIAPPVMATGTPQLAMPSPTPFVQPFPALRPMLVPAGSGILPSKYL